MQELAFVVLGWLLGLSTSPITDAIAKSRLKREIRAGLGIELRRLAFVMAHIEFDHAMRYGAWDRPLLERLRRQLMKYQPADRGTSVLAAVERFLALDDEQIVTVRAKSEQDVSLRGRSVKEFRVPFLESHLQDLLLFKPNSQRRLLELATQLDFYNTHVTDVREWTRMTFDQGLNEVDRDAVTRNLETAYNNLAERARLILEEIELAEEALSADA